MIVPIAQHKEGVLDRAYDLRDQLAKIARVDIDASDKMPGWKFNEAEMKGYPIRIEIGPRDIENEQVVVVRRDTLEKEFVSMAELDRRILEILDDVQKNLYDKALKHREEKTTVVTSMDDMKQALAENPGFMKAMWCGDIACEDKIQEEFSVTSRCIPFEQEKIAETCFCCGKEAKEMVYWARAY